MKKFPVRPTAVLAVLFALQLVVPAPAALARIEDMSLREMVRHCDDAVYAEIVDRHVFRVEERGGGHLYFTRLTLEGQSLHDGVAIRVDVLFHGGFIDEENGVFNSEAPPADDTAVGTRAVVFYRWVEDLGGGVAGNALFAAHGGLFRTVQGPQGAVALGRGQNYALDSNVQVNTLRTAVPGIAQGD